MGTKKLVDISVTKSVTIPAANYGNVKPSITLTIKDVPINEVEDVYKQATEVADAMWALEAISALDESTAISEIGHARYLEQLKRSKDKMTRTIKEFSEAK